MARSSGSRGRRSQGGRGRRGVGKRRTPKRKDQAQLDYEMDMMNAERDGRDVEEIKAAYRAKREAERKEKLDKDMDSYFSEQKDVDENAPNEADICAKVPASTAGVDAPKPTNPAVSASP